eukprot:6484159-Amphidinium_carterae.1
MNLWFTDQTSLVLTAVFKRSPICCVHYELRGHECRWLKEKTGGKANQSMSISHINLQCLSAFGSKAMPCHIEDKQYTGWATFVFSHIDIGARLSRSNAWQS